MNQTDMEKMFGAPITIGSSRRTGARWFFQEKAHHLWCPRCFRVFPNGVHGLTGEVRTCPYNDCGAEEQDAQAWDELRSERPNYPEHPWLGIRYPLTD